MVNVVIALECFGSAYAFKILKVFDLTTVMLAIAMSIVIVVIVVWSRRNYDFRHLAAEKVLESIGDGVISLDDDNRLVNYNEAAAQIFTGLSTYKPGEDIQGLEGFQEEMLREDISYSFSMHGRFYESHSKQIIGENGRKQGCVILFLDMTDIKAYIDEIKQVRRQAEQASIAKSEFLANVSHEIRTPMNAIIGLNDIIMEECTDPELYNHAKEVKSAAKSLLVIINDILDLSKVEAGKIELIYSDYYLKAMTGEVVRMIDMTASRQGLIIKYEYDGSMPCCYYGDEGRIKQILINILSNAIKFTKEGYVWASVSGSPGENEDEELITFCVEDTGCGIRKEDLDKIFEDFRQVDSRRNRSVEGTGLGLAIVKHLVDLMGGNIHVESTYGVGTKVTVTIPQKIVDRRSIAEMPDVPQAEKERVETFTASDVKVLIVDDNMINRKVARGVLKNYGFDLMEAESGPKSIELVRANRFDLIFMDHMMPEMDGIEAVDIIRHDCGENGTFPVIVALTADVMEGMREHFLENGFQDFIAKPIDRREMNQLLMKWVPEERRRGKDPEAESACLNPDDFRIEGLDMKDVVQHFSGDGEAFTDLLELFCIDGKRKTVLLRDLADTDVPGYQVEVHGLKSTAANIGAVELSALAKEQEEAAARGDTEYIRRQQPVLMEVYEKLLAGIGQFLEENRQSDTHTEKLPDLSVQELKEQAGTALDELERFRSGECARIVEEILLHSLPRDVEESLTRIREQLKLYEDDYAEELLGQLLRKLEGKGMHG